MSIVTQRNITGTNQVIDSTSGPVRMKFKKAARKCQPPVTDGTAAG
jgi:hypothetical protein